MNDIAISVQNVTKQYFLYQKRIHRIFETFHPSGKTYHTPFHALNNFSLNVLRGETVGIIGRNGSGKSTLLQLVCGILSPTHGNVTVNGRVSALLELGAGFNPEFTGRENVYLNTAILGLTREETDERFDRIAAFAEIGDFIDRPVKMYSSGMYVRLAFATAISVDPDILIVDEALAVGDIFFQQKCVAHMKKMVESCTILLVSHDMHAISNLCDRVVLLDRGNEIFDGKPTDGIALYTKLVHTERFAEKEKVTEDALEIPVDIEDKLTGEIADFHEWIPVPPEKSGGAGDVSILKVSVTKKGVVFKSVQQGDQVRIRLLIRANRPVDEIIFGYTVKDRVGVGLFGENSLCLENNSLTVAEGFSIIDYTFTWPEVYPQEYTLTLGIGEGHHPLVHKIQCWAHNIVSFSAVTPGKSVHGIFNNPLETLTIAPVQ